jgi:heme exporter protein A
MLKVSRLYFDYPAQSLLQDVQLTVNPGTLMHIRGSNGSGKTTLLKLLAGLLTPISGEILWNNDSITDNLSAYQHNLCYVGHKTGMSQLLTVKENCHYDVIPHHSALSDTECIQTLGLASVNDVACGLLSVGQKRRVGLLRLLTSKAPLWLLDEPFVALDETALSTLMNIINNHIEQKGIIVLTSHQSLPSATKGVQEYCL